MSLLFDANLSPQLIENLRSDFPGSKHAIELDLRASDRQIWAYALENSLAIVTKDSDFDTLSFLLAPPGKVIRITLGNCTTKEITSLIVAETSNIKRFLGNDDETLLILP